jgi:hypothetical protein
VSNERTTTNETNRLNIINSPFPGWLFFCILLQRVLIIAACSSSLMPTSVNYTLSGPVYQDESGAGV